MIARLARILLLLQFLVAVAIGALLYHTWSQPRAAMPLPALLLALLALLVGFFCVLLCRLLINANNFHLAWRHRDPDLAAATPHGAARLRWPAMLKLLTNEFCASLLTSSWTMAFRRVEQQLFDDAAGMPVLLIHGYGCNSGYWQSMSRRLSAARISHAAIDLEPVFADIDGYATQVDAAVDDLCRLSGHARVVILAHSMGGLVVRAWLRRFGGARLACAITLGTPHQGTVLASFGIGLNSRQMRRARRIDSATASGTSSDWLQTLQRMEPAAMRERFVSIRSRHDNIVAPQSAAMLEGACNIVVEGVGHVALASNPVVQQHVLDAILAANRLPCSRRY